MHVLLSNLFLFLHPSGMLIFHVSYHIIVQLLPKSSMSSPFCFYWLITTRDKDEQNPGEIALCISTAPPVNVLSPINAPSVRLNGDCLA